LGLWNPAAITGRQARTTVAPSWVRGVPAWRVTIRSSQASLRFYYGEHGHWTGTYWIARHGFRLLRVATAYVQPGSRSYDWVAILGYGVGASIKPPAACRTAQGG
jgi:hypothetical protein